MGGWWSESLPRSRFGGGLRRCLPARPPARAPFLSTRGSRSRPRREWPAAAPRVPAGPRLRGAGRRAAGGGRAAGDRQKAPTSQPLLDPSAGDRSGQPEGVKEKGFATAGKREKKRGEEGGRQERSDAEER